MSNKEKGKRWTSYSKKNLLQYILENSNQMDCSFLIKRIQGKDPDKIVQSWQWLLSDISPVLRRIFDSQENHEKNCKLIPITDRNFEIILSYAHTKILPKMSFEQQMDVYESARNFEIEPLMVAIIGRFQCYNREILNEGKWIDFFEVAYVKKQVDLRLFSVFHSVIRTIKSEDIEKDLEKNSHKVLKFDGVLFYDFLSFLKDHNTRPLLCLDLAETYLKEKLFKQKSVSSFSELNNIDRDIVNLFLENIDFENINQHNLECTGDCIKFFDNKKMENYAMKT